MKRTVFISSTFINLKEHRRRVWDLLDTYDVNIRGMRDLEQEKKLLYKHVLPKLNSQTFLWASSAID